MATQNDNVPAQPDTESAASLAGPSTRPARLSVNLGEEPAAALREIMTRQDISATEAVRRAISLLKFVEDEQRAGNRLAIIEAAGRRRWLRRLLLLGWREPDVLAQRSA
ncbi:CopG family transcriptional regulator [Cryptosporangium sp. NPDC048952]|uniref:CopG family transcriptional regulator n=1 Tax=Cryptosporangium sp. NPDC048952 TaxID=3363961 RepID=UPI00371D7820